MNFVKITYPDGEFEIMETQVTQGDWTEIMGSNPSYFKGDLNLPVEQVSWNDTQNFIQKLNASQKDYVYRLPKGKEWEFACGKDPEILGDHAWYYENSNNKTHPVKQKKPNEFGLYDMLGNVWEWCEDLYDKNSGSFRVIRGGGWNGSAHGCQSAIRSYWGPDFRYSDVGFRLVRTPVSLGTVTLDHSMENRLTIAIKALKEIAKHGCCVMHNDSGCPGCRAHKALKDIGAW